MDGNLTTGTEVPVLIIFLEQVLFRVQYVIFDPQREDYGFFRVITLHNSSHSHILKYHCSTCCFMCEDFCVLTSEQELAGRYLFYGASSEQVKA